MVNVRAKVSEMVNIQVTHSSVNTNHAERCLICNKVYVFNKQT